MAYSAATLVKAGSFQMVWGLVKYLPSPVGDWLRFAVLKLFMKDIRTSWIRSGVTIWWPERIAIGDGSINEDIHLNGFGGITVGDRVMIGHRTTLFSDEHNFADPERTIWSQGRTAAPIVIEDDVYLGCNVVVLAGVTIGKGAVIGASSVVTRDIPPLSIAVGAPARVIGKRGEERTANA